MRLPNFLYRNLWTIINSFIALSIFFFLLFYKGIEDYCIQNLSLLTSISGTLIGFLLTALALFYSLPIRAEIKDRLIQFQYNVIIPKLLFIGMMVFFLQILVFLFFQETYFIQYALFIFGLLETVVATLYIIKLARRGT